MTEPVDTERFDETATRHSTSKTSDGSVLPAILKATQAAGIDPVSELYNEALELAKVGHIGRARERLQVLLGLAPADGDAHLLLAKVHYAGQQWRRAVSELDEAAECGADVPAELRDAAIRHVQADVDEDEEERAARVAREQGELKKLRSDTRRLRSEHAHLAARVRQGELEAKRWMWVASGTSLVAILFIGAEMFFGIPSVDAAGAVDDTIASVEADVTAPATAAVSGGVVRDPDLKARADDALAAAGFAEAKAIVRGTKASLSGTVPTHADKKKAGDVVSALGIVESVDTESLVVLAVRDGATYTVVSGDTLSRIALRMYGQSSLADGILTANPELGGKASALRVGQALKIPAVDL